MSATGTVIDVKELYAASTREPSIVDVPDLQFLMVDGTGDPNSASRLGSSPLSRCWLGRKDSNLQPSDPEQYAISPIALSN
jgi:hypothetical protein